MKPEEQDVAQALDRVLKSSHFMNASRQRRFLRHVVEMHLAGQNDSLREFAIGLAVYDRRPSYDPKEDPIVRVEASRLRARLREYYQFEGAQEQVHIDIPKGSYVPTFSWNLVQLPELQVFSLAPPVERVESRKLSWPLAAMVMLGVGFLASVVWLVSIRSMRDSTPFHVDSVAVLPFSDLSEKRDLDQVASGLTEQIQDELTRNTSLRVVGGTTSRQLILNSDLREAAREVGVHGLIQGSVRQEGDMLRVTVRLLDGSTGAAVWAKSFDGRRGNQFELEERLANSVGERIRTQNHGGTSAETATAEINPKRAQAIDYCQQARTLSLRDSAGPLDEIFSLYQLATITDPSYAPAHAGLAATIIMAQGALGGPDSAGRSFKEAETAIRLDPGLPQAYASLILYYRDEELDWAKAEQQCLQLLSRFPNSTPLLIECASVEGLLLHPQRDLELVRRAVQADPLSPSMHGALMFALYQSGQMEEALKEADYAIEKGSSSAFVYRHQALILAAMGRPEEGLRAIDQAEARLGGVSANWSPVRGYLLGRLGRLAEANALLHRYRSGDVPAHHIGMIYLGMGDRDKALTWYERALVKNRADVAHAIPEWYMRTLDGEPRLKAIKLKFKVAS